MTTRAKPRLEDVRLGSYADAQDIAQVSRSWLKTQLRDGRLRRYKAGRATRIDLNELLRLMANSGR